MKAIKKYNVILLGAIVCLPALCFGQNTNTAKTAATVKAQPVPLKIKNKQEVAQEREQKKQAQLIEKDATYNKEQPAAKEQETDKAWGNYEEESNDKVKPATNEMMRMDNSPMEMQPQKMQMRKGENTINKDEQKPKQE